jgi:hypothetical protein
MILQYSIYSFCLLDYRCECPDWTLGKNCEVVFSPCNRVNCQHNSQCLKKRTLAYECNCTQGYTGLLCDQLTSETCLVRPCVDGNCELDINGRYACKCRAAGYSGLFCEIQRCNPNCVKGYCDQDQAGNYFCRCDSGYSGPACANMG